MSITVILNGYKRPKSLPYQLEAIKNQTLPAEEIMLWQNLGDEFDENITKKTIHAKCNKNLGVWARFAFALNARTDYICIFDDDTIPGPRWLENCMFTMQDYDGLLGTIGLRFQDEFNYSNNIRLGWDNPNPHTEQVDIVGHSWFFKREDLSIFWRELPDKNLDSCVGEDMHFSYMLQKYTNKKTYVPPHPINNKELWGSQPFSAWTLGTDNHAISLNSHHAESMHNMYKTYISKGFRIMKTTD